MYSTEGLMEGSSFLARGLKCPMKKSTQSIARGTSGTHCRSERSVWFVNLGKAIIDSEACCDNRVNLYFRSVL
jgi:hypothetical protein